MGVVLQIGNFAEFASWLFGLLALGFASLFWLWLSSMLKGLNERWNQMREDLRGMQLYQSGVQSELCHLQKDFDEMLTEQKGVRAEMLRVAGEIIEIRAQLRLLHHRGKVKGAQRTEEGES